MQHNVSSLAYSPAPATASCPPLDTHILPVDLWERIALEAGQAEKADAYAARSAKLSSLTRHAAQAALHLPGPLTRLSRVNRHLRASLRAPEGQLCQQHFAKAWARPLFCAVDILHQHAGALAHVQNLQINHVHLGPPASAQATLVDLLKLLGTHARALKQLTLASVNLTGMGAQLEDPASPLNLAFAALAQAPRLSHLTFSMCQDLSTLPVGVLALRRLQHLRVDFCGLRQLPAALPQRLERLTSLGLSGNFHLAVLPAGMRALVHLKLLDLGENCHLSPAALQAQVPSGCRIRNDAFVERTAAEPTRAAAPAALSPRRPPAPVRRPRPVGPPRPNALWRAELGATARLWAAAWRWAKQSS